MKKMRTFGILFSLNLSQNLYAQQATPPWVLAPLDVLAGEWKIVAASQQRSVEGILWDMSKEEKVKYDGYKGLILELQPERKINGKKQKCSEIKPFVEELPRGPGFTEIENSMSNIYTKCKLMNGSDYFEVEIPNKRYRSRCEATWEVGKVGPNLEYFIKLDDETLIEYSGSGGIGHGICLKRIDIKTLNLTSHEPYTTKKPVPEVHLFAFDFSFALPEKISVSEGNANKGTLTFSYRPQGIKTNTVCTYKGGSAAVKKGQPRPLTKEFTFEKCSDGGTHEATRSGAWFQLKVNGVTEIAEAKKTEVKLTLQRIQ